MASSSSPPLSLADAASCIRENAELAKKNPPGGGGGEEGRAGRRRRQRIAELWPFPPPPPLLAKVGDDDDRTGSDLARRRPLYRVRPSVRPSVYTTTVLPSSHTCVDDGGGVAPFSN